MSAESSVSKDKDKTVNVSTTVVETLLENILQGRTAVFPVNLLETIVGSKPMNVDKNKGKGEASCSSGFSSLEVENIIKKGCAAEPTKKLRLSPDHQKYAERTINGQNETISIGSGISGLTFGTFDDEECSVVDMDETSTTRNASPTEMARHKPVSEQFLHAKRILQQNSSSIQAPDFSNLNPELEEAFTVSTAHLTQVITSTFNDLQRSLEQTVQQKNQEMETALTAITKQLVESNKLYKSILEKQEAAVPAPNPAPVAVAPPAPVVIAPPPAPALKAEPPKPKPFDVIGNFMLYLQKIKMNEGEINHHGSQVCRLIGNEALVYMAQFGYIPKYKKKN